ncbi:MAG: hypothetical protein ACK5AZ_20850 [Bryobacteraceae bacterium]
MLLKAEVLQGVADGRVRLAFRRWDACRVRPGRTFLSPVGLIRIDSISEVDEDRISEREAHAAGFPSLAALLEEIRRSRGRNLYRIVLSFAGADPRFELREREDWTPDERETIRRKLAAWDLRGAHGPWTERVLRTIGQNPGLHARNLAELTGLPKEWLKLNVRRLKNLGLTISHPTGYELSARGRSFLDGIES